MNAAKPQILIWPPAFQDMAAISNYIQLDNPDAAKELLEEIHEKIAALADHPKLYRQGRVPGTREMLVRSNYKVVYKENPSLITILRVLHTARKYP